MKNLLLLLFASSLLVAGSAKAQVDINNLTYSYSRSGFAPTTLSSPITLIGANADDVASEVTEIGFTFWFAGTPYTQFSVNENGLMTLGSIQIAGNDFANDMASTTTSIKIAPYWDDLSTGTNGNVVYQVTGTAPNRILYVNWNVTIPKNTVATAGSLFQVQLSETSGTVSFTYGYPVIPANANFFTVGIGKSASDFASLTPTSATTATVSYGTSSNSNTISPGGYTRYNFFTDKAAPSYSTTVAIPSVPGLENRTFTATIADAKTGVPLSGDYIPRIYFKKINDANYVSTAGVLQSGASASGVWLFTVDHSLIGGVIPGDKIQYFVVAQDQATTVGVPNVSSYPSGAIATNINNVTTPPSSPSFYFISKSYAGNITVGSGGDYASLTNTGGLFENMNVGSFTGNVVVDIISDLPDETGANSLNEFAAPYTLTIRPSGNRMVTAASGDLIKLIGADRVTIDGLNDGTNSLTLISSWGSAIYLMGGAKQNTFTNLTLKGGSSGGVITMSTNGGSIGDSDNVISNNIITSAGTYKPSTGVYFYEYSTGNTGNVIDNNVISDFSMYGIQAYRCNNTTISNNDIYQSNGIGWGIGIKFDANGYSHGTSNIFNNKIHDLNTQSSNLTAAIYYMSGAASDVFNIYNNVIQVQTTSTNPTAGKIYGILLSGQGTSNVNYNTIHIGGTGITSGNSTGFYKGTVGTVTLKNNNIYNSRSNTSASIYYNHFAVAVANLTNFNADNNNMYVDGTSSYIANVGIDLGMSQGTDYATLSAWQTATSKDLNSVSVDPSFTSQSNLLPTNPAVNAGIPIAGITTDITGITRHGTIPTIGAYEIVERTKTLNLVVFIEGLYTSNGMMTRANDELGPHWPDGIADHVTIELHDGNAYSTIIHTINNLAVNVDGTATTDVPSTLGGNYFITVKHRSGLETTSANAISFSGSIISHSFDSPAGVFGANVRNMNDGHYAIYSGDVNHDGTIELLDLIPILNLSSQFGSGYLPEDTNGDGAIDLLDLIIILNNSSNFVGAITP